MSAVDDKFADALREMVKPNPQKLNMLRKVGMHLNLAG